MKALKTEKGYTLLITIIVLVLFSVLGFSLFTLTVGGITKNESREHNTQAKDLSVKGLDFVITEIQYKLDTFLRDGQNATDYKTKLEATLNEYLCTGSPTPLTNTKTGSVNTCISNIKDISVDNPYKKIVTFKSIGTADNKKFTVESTYTIGANLNLEPFTYVLSTFQNDIADNKQNGDLSLLGGIEVNGNINVASDLITSNQSTYKGVTIDSVLPRANNTKLNLKGQSYLKNKSNPKGLSQLFNNSNITNISEQALKNKYKIDELIDEFGKYSSNDIDHILNVGNLTNLGTPLGTWGHNSPSGKTILRYSGSTDYDWIVWGENKFETVTFPKDLKMRYDMGKDPKMVVSKGAYIGEDLDIGLGTALESGNPAETKVYLEGSFYVNDDLNIDNARLSGNAILFVRDNVNIQFSQISGNIIIIAGGDVNIKYVANNHNDESKRSTLTGFIHSDQSINIEGVTSLLTINGGLSANNITATSIRGRAQAACAESYEKLERYWSDAYTNCFEKAENQNANSLKIKEGITGLFAETVSIQSRVQIKYTDVKANYLNLLKIYKMDKPIEKTRAIIP